MGGFSFVKAGQPPHRIKHSLRHRADRSSLCTIVPPKRSTEAAKLAAMRSPKTPSGTSAPKRVKPLRDGFRDNAVNILLGQKAHQATSPSVAVLASLEKAKPGTSRPGQHRLNGADGGAEKRPDNNIGIRPQWPLWPLLPRLLTCLLYRAG